MDGEEMLEELKNAKVKECLHIDIDGIRIEVPLPKEKKDKILVKAVLAKASWIALPLARSCTSADWHKREYCEAEDKEIEEILAGTDKLRRVENFPKGGRLE